MPLTVMYPNGAGWSAAGSSEILLPDEDGFVLGTTKPTALNTGVGVVAPTPTVTLSGVQYVTTPGTVLENRIISGRVVVKAANVTIRNCIIKATETKNTDEWLVNAFDAAATNLTVEFCEITATGYASSGWNGIGSRRYTLRRNHIHEVVDGCSVFNLDGGATGVTIEGNLISDLIHIKPDVAGSRPDTHNDCIQIQGGTGTQIIGNTLEAVNSPESTDGAGVSGYGAVMINSGVGGTASTGDITDNWLAGGGYAINGLGNVTGLNFNILRNRFDTATHMYGPAGLKTTGNTWNIPTVGAGKNTKLNGDPISIYTIA